jgi:cardiolipin synthase
MGVALRRRAEPCNGVGHVPDRLSAAALGNGPREVYLRGASVAIPKLATVHGLGVCELRVRGNRLRCRGQSLSIPNLITLARILIVPVVVWAIASNQMLFAFLLFAAAGVSDAVDGFLAKRFGMTSELGRYLDPLADKVLIVAIYIALGIADALPRWLVILVVSRDLLIVGGVIFSWLIDKPVSVKPHPVSKLNTAVQLVLVALVLAALGFGFDAGMWLTVTMAAVAALTLASVSVYLREWVRHMGAAP